MFQLWKELAQQYRVILLYGDLWAGKTTFAKWFAEWLGISTQQVQSPTYTYLNIYENKLLHIDMYRLTSLEDTIEKWILDQISDFSFILIERPKREADLGLKNAIKMRIKKLNEAQREVDLEI